MYVLTKAPGFTLSFKILDVIKDWRLCLGWCPQQDVLCNVYVQLEDNLLWHSLLNCSPKHKKLISIVKL